MAQARLDGLSSPGSRPCRSRRRGRLHTVALLPLRGLSSLCGGWFALRRRRRRKSLLEPRFLVLAHGNDGRSGRACCTRGRDEAQVVAWHEALAPVQRRHEPTRVVRMAVRGEHRQEITGTEAQLATIAPLKVELGAGLHRLQCPFFARAHPGEQPPDEVRATEREGEKQQEGPLGRLARPGASGCRCVLQELWVLRCPGQPMPRSMA